MIPIYTKNWQAPRNKPEWFFQGKNRKEFKVYFGGFSMCYFECTPETETVCTFSSINKFETRFLNACLKWKTISSIAQKHSGTLTTYLGDLFKKEWSVLDSQLHFFQLLSVFFCSVLHILPEMEKLSVYYRLPLTVADQEWWILRSVPIFKCFFKVAVLATFVILLILNAGEKKTLLLTSYGPY